MWRLDTWKQCDLWEPDYWFSNQWFIDFDLKPLVTIDYEGNWYIRRFLAVEREQHFSEVIYRYVTVVDQSGDLMNGRILLPYDGHFRGFWNHTTPLLDAHYIKRMTCYTNHGRMRQVWFRAGLEAQDIAMMPSGRLKLVRHSGWNWVAGNMFGEIQDYGGVPLVARNGTQNLSNIWTPQKIVMFAVQGVSDMHASTRRQALGGGAGAVIVADLHALLPKIPVTWWLLKTAWTGIGGQNYIDSLVQQLLAQIAETKRLAKKVSEWFGGTEGSDGTPPHVARWYPDAGTAQDLADSFQGMLDGWKDALTAINWHTDVYGRWCNNDDWNMAIARADDLTAKAAWLITLDLKNG